jgi:hypothetical protein
MELQKKLAQIQKELNVPKNQRNNFGNYNYRSAEDILEGVKKHLDGCVLTVSDKIVLVGNRYYIKATAKLTCGTESFKTVAFAREEETKKGMDASQITGSASSYARKYALNGLFCIDDTKDADTQDNTNNNTPNSKTSVGGTKNVSGSSVTEKQLKYINTLITQSDSDREVIKDLYKVASLTELTSSQASDLIDKLNIKLGKPPKDKKDEVVRPEDIPEWD